MIPKWLQNDPKWLQNDLKTQKKERKKLSPEARQQTRFSESLKWIAKNSKGRAQKVIPGGAKTSESFWKSSKWRKKVGRPIGRRNGREVRTVSKVPRLAPPRTANQKQSPEQFMRTANRANSFIVSYSNFFEKKVDFLGPTSRLADPTSWLVEPTSRLIESTS